jgi:hypothetical protein
MLFQVRHEVHGAFFGKEQANIATAAGARFPAAASSIIGLKASGGRLSAVSQLVRVGVKLG